MEGSTPPSDTAWAMSEENVEIVRRVYEIIADGFNEETVRAAIANGLVNPDAELDLRTAYSDGPVVRLATLSEFLDTQPWGRSTRFEPESFRAVGTERVLVFLRLRGIGTGSGVEVEAPIAHLVTLRDGQVVRLASYIDRRNALEAAGLRE
jgi:ketosteroid isomerase-like protein